MAQIRSPNSHARLTPLIIAPILFGICLVGMLWGASNLPTTSKQLFGTVLVADLVRAVVYGLALLIPATLAVARLRGENYQLWRGAALAFLVGWSRNTAMNYLAARSGCGSVGYHLGVGEQPCAAESQTR